MSPHPNLFSMPLAISVPNFMLLSQSERFLHIVELTSCTINGCLLRENAASVLSFTSIGLHFPQALAAQFRFRFPVTSSQHVANFTADVSEPEFCDHHQTIAN